MSTRSPFRHTTEPRPAESAPFHSTLRMRILLFTGVILVLLLLLISQVLLYQWRSVIIAKQRDEVVAVSRTFAATALDALIREEHSGTSREGVLQTSIDDFQQSLGNVKYVAILDQTEHPIAVSPALAADVIPLRALAANRANGVAIRIFDDPRFSWVIEIHMPLRIAQKSWGTATIGFDATPIRLEIRDLFLLLFGTTLLVSLATLVVLYFLANRLTVSLTRLVNAMDSVDVGRGTATPTSTTEDDVAFLFERFDNMKKRIEQSRLQLENAQRQVYHAEKLASIGRFASGIAHQVNNPLNGIRSCLYAIGKEPENAAQTREYLDLIGEAITNIETVVQKLLGFVHQPSPSESLTDIVLSTRKVVDLFDVRLREKRVHVALDLPEGLPAVAIDHQLYQEVVMNLLVNSYDAVGREGSIFIAAGREGEDAVYLSVRDDGVGIPPENLERIFEPFFTTKEIGKGTGLGLFVCQSIIETHGGRVTVKSTPGSGAEFTVILPGGTGDERPHH
jgi:signal transduction histidine kinase